MPDPDDSERPTPDYEVHDASDIRPIIGLAVILLGIVLALVFFFLRTPT